MDNMEGKTQQQGEECCEKDSPIPSLDSPDSLSIIKSMIVAAIAVLLTVISIQSFGPSFFYEGKSTKPYDLYSVVFDAGSTGSRLFVFHFRIKTKDGQGVRLENEIFQAVEPGISAYAKDPYKAVESLEPLMERAVSSIPTQFQNSTLVTLKATAGLRLLPSETAESIINVVRRFIMSSPFYLPEPHTIRIMSGEEEGIFGWVTVNFLLDNIWDEDPDNTVTTIDLGGGSLQITFELASQAGLCNFLVKDLYRVRMLQSQFSVFTHSYLGFGLKSSRLGILKAAQDEEKMLKSGNSIQVDTDTVLLFSPCYHTGISFSFLDGDTTYIVKGTNDYLQLSPKCENGVIKFVQSANFVQNNELSRRELHLFSYFFDIARWAEMVPANTNRAFLTPMDYYTNATKYCGVEKVNEEKPLLCIDLLFVYTMLTHGVGLPPDKQMSVETQLVGREVSWSLGAALSTLSDDFSYNLLLI